MSNNKLRVGIIGAGGWGIPDHGSFQPQTRDSLSVYAAHFGDMLFRPVSFPKKLTAVIETQFAFFTVEETGEQIPNTRIRKSTV